MIFAHQLYLNLKNANIKQKENKKEQVGPLSRYVDKYL